MTAIKILEHALTLAHARLNESHQFEVFVSIVAQLEYLLSVVKDEDRNISRVKYIIVGHFAVREFAESDPEFADALHAAQAIAYKIAKGIKF
jgi:predicted nucleic acid-binding protein